MKITKGKVDRKVMILIYGSGGAGKSFFASKFPEPVFMDAEGGTFHLDVSRLPQVTSLGDIQEQIAWLNKEKHSFQTLVIDGLDHIDQMFQDEIARNNHKQTIGEIAHGKGWSLLIKTWASLMEQLKALRDAKNMDIILISHADDKIVENTELGESYRRLKVKLTGKANNIVQEQVDAVLFCTHETYVIYGIVTGKLK